MTQTIALDPGMIPDSASGALMTHSNNPATFLLRLPQVKARTGLSRSELYRRMAAGDFPQPVKLGERASAWPESEVSVWCEARIAARDAKVAV